MPARLKQVLEFLPHLRYNYIFISFFKKEGMFYGKEESRLVKFDLLLSEDR